MRAERDVTLERIPVHHAVDHVVTDVNRTQVADVIREQRLLAARVRRFVRTELRHRVVTVCFVDEEHARLARAPRADDHLLPDVACTQLTRHLLRALIEQIVVRVGLDGLHELRRDADGDIEVGDLGQIFLARNEFHHVRMIDTQNAHVRATTRAPLLHRVRAGVVQFHERDRSRRHTGRAAHHRPTRAQPRKRKARSAA